MMTDMNVSVDLTMMIMNPRLTLTRTSKRRTPTISMKMIWVSHHGDDNAEDEQADDINNSNDTNIFFFLH